MRSSTASETAWGRDGEIADRQGNDMTATGLSMTQAEITRAKAIWADYQRTHDLADRVGHVAGVDPTTGGGWIGRRFDEVATRRSADGFPASPLFLVRIGSPRALRKGGRR